MDQDDPAPPKRRRGADNGERDEGQMQQERTVGCEAKEHGVHGEFVMPVDKSTGSTVLSKQIYATMQGHPVIRFLWKSLKPIHGMHAR